MCVHVLVCACACVCLCVCVCVLSSALTAAIKQTDHVTDHFGPYAACHKVESHSAAHIIMLLKNINLMQSHLTEHTENPSVQERK